MATQTTWQYVKLSVWVTDEMGINPCWVDHYEVRPSAFQGGMNWYAASPPSTPYCSWFSNGVDLNAGAVGVYVSGQTGFNTETKIEFNFLSGGWMCGDNSLGYPSSSRVASQ